MARRVLSLAFICLLLGGVSAQERVDLSTPEVHASNPNYHLERLVLDWDGAIIYVYLRGVNGESKSFTYTGTTATSLMIALNKANLSTRSLNQRVFDRLIADGLMTGSVAGSVQ